MPTSTMIRLPISGYLSLVVVMLAPLPFGANRPGAWSLISAAIAIALIFQAYQYVIERRSPDVPLRWLGKISLFFGIAVAWIVFQMMPGGAEFLQHPIWIASEEVLGERLTSQISVDSANTFDALMRLLTYGAVFWLAVQSMRSTRNAQLMFSALIAAQLGYSIYALVVQFSGSNTILWFSKWAYLNDATSTFVNRNTFATYAGIGLILSIGILLQEFSTPLRKGYDLRQSLLFVFGHISVRTTMIALAIPATATALLLSHSRAGVVSTGLGLAVLFASASLIRGIERRKAVFVIALLALAGTGVFLLSGANVVTRLGVVDSDISGRLDFYAVMYQALADRPITGFGYGNYLSAFWEYRTAEITGYWDKAHNLYLELAIELGIPAAAFLVAANVGMIFLCLRGILRRRQNQFYPAIGLAVIALVGVHSMVDFSLQIPAVAVTYSFILGGCCAQSWRSARVAIEAGSTLRHGKNPRLSKVVASSE